MHLWSFQSVEAEEYLDKNGRLVATWRHTPLTFRPAYHWMAIQMEERGIDLGGHAPIWAWHSCQGVLHHPPTLNTVRHLLTDYQLMQGVLLLEFEAPDELCLLSSYALFLEMIDRYVEGAKPDPDLFLSMFAVPPIAAGDDIQAALPYLEADWITDRRSVFLKPGKWDYDWGQKV